jgi:hypothetical protein
VAQGEGPEFKPQYCKKQNKQTKSIISIQLISSMRKIKLGVMVHTYNPSTQEVEEGGF